ncbi:MAG: polysaccharide biosynthesis protein, partial [Akkermansiaceae bacterium]|nr:polysaccharide biosynthesis protein [Akkermansiaceae bacterium]
MAMAASLAGKLSGFLKNPTVKAVGVNTSWLMVDKLARMGVSLLMSVLIARHLGPKGFGQLSLATSFVGFFIPIASFGLDRILVRDFVKGTPEPGTILGTAMTWRVVGGLLIMLLATLISSFIYRGSNNMILLVAILGIAPVVQAGDVIDFLFQSRLESKYVAISKLSSLFLSTGIRIALLHFSASAMGFAIASLLESLLLTLFLIFSLYRRKVVKDAIRVSKTYVKRLIVEGWPLALNLAFHVVYLRVSVMCLGQMKGDAAVGQFAAATRIYDGIVPIFSLLCTSLFPTLVRAYEQDQKIFLDKFVKASKVLAAIGWCAAIGAGVGSIWVLPVLFGPKYQESG